MLYERIGKSYSIDPQSDKFMNSYHTTEGNRWWPYIYANADLHKYWFNNSPDVLLAIASTVSTSDKR